jgi:ABC-type transporter Mla MlaB component
MEFKITKDDDTLEATIRGSLTIQYAMDLKNELNIFQEKNKPKEIDLSGVEKIDTSGFQILYQLKMKHIEAGIPIVFKNHSLPVINILDLYGCIATFGDKIKIHKSLVPQFRFRYGVKK